MMISGLIAGPMTAAPVEPAPLSDSEDDDAPMTEARDSLARGNPAVAAAILIRLTATEPDRTEGWQLLAEVHEALGQTAEAARARSQARQG